VPPLQAWADDARRNRRPVPKENVFWQTQERFADWVVTCLDAYRDMRDHASEAWFHAVYGSPLVQALVGLKASDANPRRKPGADAGHRAFVAKRIEELTSRIADGGPREAAIRALLYVRMPEGVVDERGFNLLRQIRDEAGGGLTLSAFRKVVREQFLMLVLDERRAVEAIPAMLKKDPKLASRMADKLHRVIEAVGLQTELANARLAEVERLFETREADASKLEHEKARLAGVRSVQSQPARSPKH
jgi:Protein of unknown function (DUF3141)